MLFQYIGDPRNGFDGPQRTEHAGFSFEKNGAAVDVETLPNDSDVRRAVIAKAQQWFSINDHFRRVTPEMLREEAKKKVKEARDAAALAEQMTKQASEIAERELAELAGRSDDNAEVNEGDDDASDESATSNADGPVSGGPRRKRTT